MGDTVYETPWLDNLAVGILRHLAATDALTANEILQKLRKEALLELKNSWWPLWLRPALACLEVFPIRFRLELVNLENMNLVSDIPTQETVASDAVRYTLTPQGWKVYSALR